MRSQKQTRHAGCQTQAPPTQQTSLSTSIGSEKHLTHRPQGIQDDTFSNQTKNNRAAKMFTA